MGTWFATCCDERPWIPVAGAFLLFGLLIAIVALTSSLVSFGVGAVAACIWCRWLETSHEAGAVNPAQHRIAEASTSDDQRRDAAFPTVSLPATAGRGHQ